MTKKKVTKSKRPGPTNSGATKFLDDNAKVLTRANGTKRWAVPVSGVVRQIVDEANRRRLAGESSSLAPLARLLKENFPDEVTVASDTLVRAIKIYVGRDTW